MRTLWIAPVLSTFLLTGCGDLPSMEGLATQENTVFDPTLVGAWNAGTAVVIVQAGDNQSYRIHWLDAEGMGSPRILRMEGRLANISGQRVLDLTASNPGAFAIPCHVFLRVQPTAGGLKVQFIDSKWIRGQANSTVMHEGHPVLTGAASDVEAFITKFGFDDRALDDPILLQPLKSK
jgi:hypothetical protein